jgi:hypothetical protein
MRMRDAACGALGVALLSAWAPQVNAGIAADVYIWSDPGDVFPGGDPNILYVWIVFYDDHVDGLDFGLTGTHTVVSITPAPGWTNDGTLESPQLMCSSPSCIEWFAPIAAIELADAASAGSLCFTESTLTGRFCYRSACSGCWHNFLLYGGHQSGGSPPCPDILPNQDCLPPIVAVEPMSWGRLRAGYR